MSAFSFAGLIPILRWRAIRQRWRACSPSARPGRDKLSPASSAYRLRQPVPVPGRYGQSESEYAQALHLDQNASRLGLAWRTSPKRAAILRRQSVAGKVQEASRKSGLSPADQILVAESAEEALAALRKGVIRVRAPLTTPSARQTIGRRNVRHG